MSTSVHAFDGDDSLKEAEDFLARTGDNPKVNVSINADQLALLLKTTRENNSPPTKRSSNRLSVSSIPSSSFSFKVTIDDKPTSTVPDLFNNQLSDDERDTLADEAYSRLILQNEAEYVSRLNFAKAMGYKSDQGIRKRVEENGFLFVVSGAAERKKFPLWQIYDKRPLPGLEDVLAGLGFDGLNGRFAVEFFTSRHEELAMKTPLECLISGNRMTLDKIVTLAKKFAMTQRNDADGYALRPLQDQV